MYKVLITSIYNGFVTTAIADCDSSTEADKVVNHIHRNKNQSGVTRLAERLN
jgi:hypothetical protein